MHVAKYAKMSDTASVARLRLPFNPIAQKR